MGPLNYLTPSCTFQDETAAGGDLLQSCRPTPSGASFPWSGWDCLRFFVRGNMLAMGQNPGNVGFLPQHSC